MRVLLVVQYDGTNYCGWQKQDNALGVQEVLQDCLQKILKQKIQLFASGRTDAGVHAKNQYVHFDLDKDFDVSRLPYTLSSILPSDISVLTAFTVSDDFHTRFSAKSKTYEYRLYQSKVVLPLANRYSVQCKNELNIKKIKAACKYFVGKHNFRAFCIPKNIPNQDFERTIYAIKIKKQKNFITFGITGSGFLHNMVRIIVGTLIDVGLGKIEPEQIKDIILSQDRTKAGRTMPAKGLTLVDVGYGKDFAKKLANK